jgi:two-component system OmpR family response regulator
MHQHANRSKRGKAGIALLAPVFAEHVGGRDPGDEPKSRAQRRATSPAGVRFGHGRKSIELQSTLDEYDWRRFLCGIVAAVMRRIAIVEDEPAIRANYAEALRRHGYDVATYANRADALAAFRTRLPDLALVDIGLGDDMDGGFTLTRELRAMSATVPILFLSARDSDFDIVAGLRLGADDYLTKDVSLPHLAARIAALFRRSELLAAPPASEDIVERGALTLDVKRLTADWNGRRVDLTLTEFWMVHALARHPGHVKDRDALMRDASIVVDDSTITSHVKRIRRKFQALDPAFDRIATVYGMGYRWGE